MGKLVAAAMAALTLSIGVSGAESPTEYKLLFEEATNTYRPYRKVVTYKTVIDYKKEEVVSYKTVTDFRIEKVEVVKYATLYDDDNRPHMVKRVYFTEVEIPVKKLVSVVKQVEVPVKKVVPVIEWVKVRYDE
jgi:hypothetical protein